MTHAEWTIEQAAELVLEQLLSLLDGCDDEDTVRPALVFEAVRQAWSPATEATLPDGMTAGELRRRLQAKRQQLAEGEKIP